MQSLPEIKTKKRPVKSAYVLFINKLIVLFCFGIPTSENVFQNIAPILIIS